MTSAHKKTLRTPVSNGNSQGSIVGANYGQAEVDGNRSEHLNQRATKDLGNTANGRGSVSGSLAPTDEQYIRSREIKNVSLQAGGSRYAQFSELMMEWGFSGTQLLLMNDALREVGLEITERNSE